PVITLGDVTTFVEDDTESGDLVASFTTADEDGNSVTVTLSDNDNGYYALDGNTVVLTDAGANLVNSGGTLPEFTLTPNDGTTNGASVSATPSITAANDAPVITLGDVTTFVEDDTESGDLVASFTTADEDGNSVTVTLSDNDNGYYALDGNTVVLTDAGANLVNSGGTLPEFTLTPNDGTTNGASVSATPSITATNDAPVITLGDVTTFVEDETESGDLVASFTTADEDGDSVTVTLSDNDNGYYALDGNTVVLTDAGANLVNSGSTLPEFTLTPNDGTNTDTNIGASVSATPSITAVNDAAILSDDVVSIAEDSGTTHGNVLDNDTDEDTELSVIGFTIQLADNSTITGVVGQPLTIIGIGVLVLTASGAYAFTPEADWNGTVPEITYTTNTNDSAKLLITVTPVDDKPIASDDHFLVNHNNNQTISYSGTVATNDQLSADGENQFSLITNTTQGSVTLNNDGSFTYTLDNGYVGDVLFTYQIIDADGSVSQASAIITINSVNAEDDGNAYQDATINIVFDSDFTAPELGSDGYQITTGTIAANGVITTNDGSQISVNSDGDGIGASYSANSSGVDQQLEYNAATGASEALIFTFDNPMNSLTFSVSKLYASEKGGEQGVWYTYLNGELVATDTFKTEGNSTTGTFEFSTGDIEFDTLIFAAINTVNPQNSGDSSDYLLASLTVTNTNTTDVDNLVSSNSVLTVNENALLSNDDDPQGDAFTLTHINQQIIEFNEDGQAIIELDSGAILTINSDGTYSYDPNAQFDALTEGEIIQDSFEYTITDEYGATDTATVTLNIIGTGVPTLQNIEEETTTDELLSESIPDGLHTGHEPQEDNNHSQWHESNLPLWQDNLPIAESQPNTWVATPADVSTVTLFSSDNLDPFLSIGNDINDTVSITEETTDGSKELRQQLSEDGLLLAQSNSDNATQCCHVLEITSPNPEPLL
ncbi:MAG: Ig-like domain-containing protein, partial [Ferrimonas sp.]